ncbi:hypothetical protein FA95DRAFT_1558589 [Auriscalpium vulgare]|uniref:Uncharacterized protein n=1 Tax=Auriscalpium vulgare TaxID=40419 RepID=A0ACB8RV40_9AGAM|nr:hypothetical protein FA95DRAFT_1558589 [Auriscalpium vulgare]
MDASMSTSVLMYSTSLRYSEIPVCPALSSFAKQIIIDTLKQDAEVAVQKSNCLHAETARDADAKVFKWSDNRDMMSDNNFEGYENT